MPRMDGIRVVHLIQEKTRGRKKSLQVRIRFLQKRREEDSGAVEDSKSRGAVFII